jgi:fused signal recognition particle receptor
MSLFGIFGKNKEEGGESKSWFEKLKSKLFSTSSVFGKIFGIFNSSEVDYGEIEQLLLDVDIDYDCTQKIISDIKEKAKNETLGAERAREVLYESMLKILNDSYKKFDIEKYDGLKVLFFYGINGGGKTTSIAKIASLFKQQYKTMLVGCDSFRIAANDQLKIWAEKIGVDAYDSNDAGTQNPPAIVYKSIDYANKSGHQLLLIDTSGRMATNRNLMDELKKTCDVLKKHSDSYPQEGILVLDGTLGQNTYFQVEEFSKYVKLTGFIVTKLDGISKGGIILSLAHKYRLPIYFIGIGETQDDINYFEPEDFVKSILNE